MRRVALHACMNACRGRAHAARRPACPHGDTATPQQELPGHASCLINGTVSLAGHRRVDEEDYGGHMELIVEGLPFAVGTFLVSFGNLAVVLGLLAFGTPYPLAVYTFSQHFLCLLSTAHMDPGLQLHA